MLIALMVSVVANIFLAKVAYTEYNRYNRDVLYLMSITQDSIYSYIRSLKIVIDSLVSHGASAEVINKLKVDINNMENYIDKLNSIEVK